mmetsp:Transcript_6015/g.13163  ORF Transcript_6015/g.13163 Transcript_6015/m.13163 type:complete len:215 (-) Transcript_6015:2158-2802(-)
MEMLRTVAPLAVASSSSPAANPLAICHRPPLDTQAARMDRQPRSAHLPARPITLVLLRTRAQPQAATSCSVDALRFQNASLEQPPPTPATLPRIAELLPIQSLLTLAVSPAPPAGSRQHPAQLRWIHAPTMTPTSASLVVARFRSAQCLHRPGTLSVAATRQEETCGSRSAGLVVRLTTQAPHRQHVQWMVNHSLSRVAVQFRHAQRRQPQATH